MKVMLTLASKKSRSAFAHRKAPEDWRTPGRFAQFVSPMQTPRVLDCGGPPPLFPGPHPICAHVTTTALEYAAPDGAFYFV